MSRFVLTLVALASLVPLADLDAADGAGEAAATAPVPAALAGKTFAIEIVSGEGEKTADVLTFDGATLSSKSYAESRFAPGPCTVKGKGDALTFSATMASPRGSEAAWEGTVSGGTISGSVTTGLKGQRERSSFTGKAQ